MIVLDASTVVELLTNGPLADALSRDLAGRSDAFIVPHLLDVEAVSALRNLAGGRHAPSRLVERARKLILEGLADPQLRLAALSHELGVTPNHLSSQFSRETGRSFRGYLAFVRVEAAKRLLATSTLKVWEVAEQVGFLNVEHFSRVFKKLTGVPPHLFTRHPAP